MAARGARLIGALLLGMGSWMALPASANEVGDRGAEIYCFMRTAGNPHTVSWEAAYARIKRQSSGLFKTSPEHAAVLITETVVNNKDKYSSCGRFLGALYSGREETGADSTPNLGSGTKAIESSRYSY
jgi:hypothetical protein